MADRGHVHPDLVSSAGFEPAFDEGRVVQDFEPLPVSHGPLAAVALDDGDLLAVGGRAGERRVDAPPLVVGTPLTIAR